MKKNKGLVHFFFGLWRYSGWAQNNPFWRGHNYRHLYVGLHTRGGFVQVEHNVVFIGI